MRKQVFEIRSPVIQQNAIQYIQQIYPNHEKPLIVTIQERAEAWTKIAGFGQPCAIFPNRLTGMAASWTLNHGNAFLRRR